LAACPQPDILVNNNAGPPFKDFREIDRAAMLAGVTQNMVTPIELIQATVDHMIAQQFGRIVNITSYSIKMPIIGLDLSSGARAGLTGFLAGVSRPIAHNNVTINGLLPGMFDTDRLRANVGHHAKIQDKTEAEVAAARAAPVPARRFGDRREFGQACASLCSAHAGYIAGHNLLVDGGVYNSSMY